MAFKQPETLDECEERIAKCAAEQTSIVAKLSDTRPMMELSTYAYGQWKTGLHERMALLVRERKLLEAWRSATNRKRTDAAEAAKQTRLELRSRPRGDESQIIRELYGIIRSLYKHHDAHLSDGAQEAIGRAETYLVERDILRSAQRISRVKKSETSNSRDQ